MVLAGATATGKTRLALELAEHLLRHGPGAEIVSADSRQVYRGMDIGTAKATAAEQARFPHHGLDVADPEEDFTVASYRLLALDALAGIAARGRVAILAGGSGLYLRVVARGVPVDAAGHDPAIRAELEARLGRHGPEPLVRELCTLAPDLARRTDLANPRRVVRALERARLLGDTPPPVPVGYPGPVTWLGVRRQREIHDRVIAERARHQFQGGLLEEAAALQARFGNGPRAFSAMSYEEAFAVLDGRLEPEAAVTAVAVRTIRYARRQGTWFRGEPDITWLPDDQTARLAAATAATDHLLDATRGPLTPDTVS